MKRHCFIAIKYLFMLGQIALAILAFRIFFLWAPNLSCTSIEEFPELKYENIDIPSNAGCFNINHGQVLFREHAPITEDPKPFIWLSLKFLFTIITLFVCNYAGRFFSKKAELEEYGKNG